MEKIEILKIINKSFLIKTKKVINQKMIDFLITKKFSNSQELLNFLEN